MQPVGQAWRATIGYLVYNDYPCEILYRRSRTSVFITAFINNNVYFDVHTWDWQRSSNNLGIQNTLCIQDTLSSRARLALRLPLGRMRRASKGILHVQNTLDSRYSPPNRKSSFISSVVCKHTAMQLTVFGFSE